ncbi:ABC transporter substrate-binding protein [Streptomyces thermocarboxydus]
MTAVGVAAALGSGLLAGCSTGTTGPGAPDRKIKVWSLENLPDRAAATRKTVAGFEKKTGIDVQLVTVDEGQLPQLIMSAAAAGELPDVIGAVPMGQVWQMYSNGLLNTEIPKQVIDGHGRDTFNANALELTSDGATSLSVPSDSWLQLMVYRQDDFDRKKLAAPDTYERALTAAEALTTKGTTASPRPPTPATSSPRRASRASRSPTTANWSTTSTRWPSTHRSARRRSAPTTGWPGSTAPPARRPWTPPAPPTSPAGPR